MVIKQTDLQFTEGTSDKVYMIALHQYDSHERSFRVICHYGRRGSTLKMVDKGTFYNFADAYDMYVSLIGEKKRKGYWTTGTFDHETGSSVKTSVPKAEPVIEKVEPVIESWTSTEEERSNALKRLRESCPAW